MADRELSEADGWHVRYLARYSDTLALQIQLLQVQMDKLKDEQRVATKEAKEFQAKIGMLPGDSVVVRDDKVSLSSSAK